MTDERPAEPPDLQRHLELLRELEDLIRRQGRRQQAAEAEARRLRRVVDEAAMRLGAMLTGERASRAALQAVVDNLRAAAAAEADEEA